MFTISTNRFFIPERPETDPLMSLLGCVLVAVTGVLVVSWCLEIAWTALFLWCGALVITWPLIGWLRDMPRIFVGLSFEKTPT